MADKIDPKKDNKDAESGQPVQLDEDTEQTGQPQPRPAQRPDPSQSGRQHGGGLKR